MHTDARTLEDDSLIEADICIVGAGAAGIALALELKDSSLTVALLEGGGFDPEVDMQQFYKGKSLGAPYNMPLEFARLHYFGGTTGHWSGWSTPLDPIDFEQRDWIPHSGWPISKTQLDPYYARAHPYLELGPYEYDAGHYESPEDSLNQLPLDPGVVWTKMWQFSPPTRFGINYREDIIQSDNIHLYTYARAVNIKANESVTQVNSIQVKSTNNTAHTVRCRHFVLACGSIQNARLLLASNTQNGAGIGNDHDQVGRYFMEHFEMAGAQLLLHEPDKMLLYSSSRVKDGRRPPSAELAISAAAQKEHQILNGTASLRPGVFEKELRNFFQSFASRQRVWEMDNWQQKRRLRVNTPPEEGYRAFKLQSRAEQAPNPHSRIMLSNEKDAMDMPRADLLWQLTALDKRSIRVFYEVIGQEFGKQNLGRLQILDWLLDDDTTWPSFLGGGFHHMGTTRMHDDAKQGVVDANCKVHGLANLHVAGASTFTTGGAANPTLTIVALAIRLADQLKATS